MGAPSGAPILHTEGAPCGAVTLSPEV